VTNTNVEHVITALTSIISQIPDDCTPPKYQIWFKESCLNYKHSANAQYLMSHIGYLLQLARFNIKGKTVIDAGCGFGATCLVFWLMGAAKVHGVDIYEVTINTINSYLKLFDDGPAIHCKLGDVADLDYEDETFDLILSNEAISHYNDVDGFISEAYRVLKPGGTLIICDANNGLNLGTAIKTRRIWEAFENGPRNTTLYGHTVVEPFIDIRKKMIREKFTSVTEEQVHFLASRTSGLYGAQLFEACQNYLSNNQTPDYVYKPNQCPVHPESGMYMEYLFNPYQLAKRIEHIGFSTKVYAYFGTGARNFSRRFAIQILRTLTPLTIFFAPVFNIVAKKK
jgi:2-polyprenyl-3-methyl-5-hydroxy-6-metoxy-1,4-benzoquinol methylase